MAPVLFLNGPAFANGMLDLQCTKQQYATFAWEPGSE
jgi:hypothetical protein